jgi:aspartokinase/homoserine dehydrogenase 1
MKIFKFGGTSVATPECIQNIIRIIQSLKKEDRPRAIVVSAFGGVTDHLIEMSRNAAAGKEAYLTSFRVLSQRHLQAVNKLIPKENRTRVRQEVKAKVDELADTLHGVFLVKELSPKSLDFIMSFGERLSAYIICESFQSIGIPSEFLDTRPLFKTNETFGFARVDKKTTNKNLQAYFKQHPKLQIVTGFIGSTENNETTTLGRGGSDYTASILGAALSAKEIQIWTDVDGVMTADPKKVPKAFPIDSMTFEEAMELSHFGAKVIYPPTVQPASKSQIPILIKNTFRPDLPGTRISQTSESNYLVKGISSIDNIALLRVQGSGMIGVAGTSNRLFGALARKSINVILITQASSEHSICFAVDPKSVAEAGKVIEEEFDLEIAANRMDKVIVEESLSIIAIVGEKMREKPGIAGRCFQALGKNGINIVAISQGSSELNISVVINRENEAKALNALHEAFFLSGTKSLNLFVLGTGLIGSTLFKQIKGQAAYLKSQLSLDIRLIGIGNIDLMLFDETGISFDQWEKRLSEGGAKTDLNRFFDTMHRMNLPNSVFVDCSDSDAIVTRYESVLNNSISIVTPNKRANSGPYDRYQQLKESAFKHGVKFLYETNVGAGLPVISTLNDLISSGDRILKIEAVLSGTLSYIFNSFSGNRKFSEIVREAREKGYSEPDPREDLNGLDVARKLLILARDAGAALEPEDVHIENILPPACQKATTIEQFFKELGKVDSLFEQKRKKAEAKNHILRYIATLEKGKASIVLKEGGDRHPFCSLSGSDNMVVFTTERYKERPLVIKGPGAGADVTAAGVFADIIRIASFLT